jgi:hypothetical protein
MVVESRCQEVVVGGSAGDEMVFYVEKSIVRIIGVTRVCLKY